MTPTTPPPEIGVSLSTPQAARALGIGERQLRRYMAGGVIAGHRMQYSQRWRIPTTEVQRVADVLGIPPDWGAAMTEMSAMTETTTPKREPGD